MNLLKAMDLLLGYNLPEHIIAHSYKVTKVAWIIANELYETGVNVKKKLVLYSALLHDITKYDSILNKGEDHAVTGGIFLRKLGYSEIAEVVESHINLIEGGNNILEKKIVYYSDKRVMHDKVVSLEERYNDLLIRYANSIYSESMIKKGLEKAQDVEREIFDKINFTPGYLNLVL